MILRRKQGRLRVVLMAALALGGCITARPPQQPSAQWRDVTLGVGEDYPKENRSQARATEDLAAARDAGARVLRVAFDWDAMEPKRGKYDWSFWDEFVPLAVKKYNLQLVPYVCYTPRWAASDPGGNFRSSPPRDPADFARFMSALVKRYRRYVRTWELWNEPDNTAYWSGTSEEFAGLIRAGSEGVRAADRRAKVVLGGIAGDVAFLEQLFREHRIAPAVDVVNIHNYFETWHPRAIEQLPDYVADVAAVVRDHGENEPLWMAEVGYSSIGPRPDISSAYRARFDHEHTAEAQANALVRMLIMALADGRLSLVAWSRINDLPEGSETISDENSLHLGLWTAEGRVKPAALAFARLAKLFGQKYRMLTPEVQKDSENPGEIQVHTFALEDGRIVVATWMALPEEEPASDQLMPDVRFTLVRVHLPNIGARVLRAMDGSGELLPEGKARAVQRGDDVELSAVLLGGHVALCVLEPQK
jgi:hypothetical protein